MKTVGHMHIASEGRLFIDSNKTSLKRALLHNSNEFPSIPVTYASHLRVLRSYENENYTRLRIRRMLEQ